MWAANKRTHGCLGKKRGWNPTELCGDFIMNHNIRIPSSNKQYFNGKYPMVFFVAHLWLWIFSSGLFTAGRWSPQNGGDCKRHVPQNVTWFRWYFAQIIGRFFWWYGKVVMFLHRMVFGVVKEFLWNRRQEEGHKNLDGTNYWTVLVKKWSLKHIRPLQGNAYL